MAWTTGVGGTGLSVFYTQAADDATANLGTFFNAIKAAFPSAVSWAIPSSGDEFESTTGTLTGAWSGGTAATIAATGGAAVYIAGTGGYVRWDTGSIVNGRRLKGRTFLCPLVNDQFDSSGTLNNTTVSTWQTAVNTLVAVNKLFVWHRPSPGGSDGFSAIVSGGTVLDKVTSLRSRRS